VTEQLHYTMLVQWSEADRAYVVTLPEWEGRVCNPITHGDTYEQAIENAHDALSALVASARQHNEQLPAPQILAVHGR
jgi:predicted RNase H-like HicB family nuclease